MRQDTKFLKIQVWEPEGDTKTKAVRIMADQATMSQLEGHLGNIFALVADMLRLPVKDVAVDPLEIAFDLSTEVVNSTDADLKDVIENLMGPMVLRDLQDLIPPERE